MAINHYESVIIINAALEDPQIEQTITSIKENIKSNGGEISDIEDWGRKRLAYTIDNAKSGYYIITRFSSPTSAIKEFERTCKLDENVIRYMTIVLDKRDLEHIELAKNKKEDEPDSENEPVVQEKTND